MIVVIKIANFLPPNSRAFRKPSPKIKENVVIETIEETKNAQTKLADFEESRKTTPGKTPITPVTPEIP